MEPGEKKISLHKLQQQYDLSKKDLEILENEEGLENYRTPSKKSRWFLSEIREALERRKARLRQEAKLSRGWGNSESHISECRAEIKKSKNPAVQAICDKNHKDVIRESAMQGKQKSKREKTYSGKDAAFLADCHAAL